MCVHAHVLRPRRGGDTLPKSLDTLQISNPGEWVGCLWVSGRMCWKGTQAEQGPAEARAGGSPSPTVLAVAAGTEQPRAASLEPFGQRSRFASRVRGGASQPHRTVHRCRVVPPAPYGPHPHPPTPAPSARQKKCSADFHFRTC